MVVFYNDRSAEIEIDETFQKLWRSIPVQSIDEEKIQEYLDKQGITSVDDPGIRKVKYFYSLSLATYNVGQTLSSTRNLIRPFAHIVWE